MMYSGIHSVQMTRVSLRHLFTNPKEKIDYIKTLDKDTEKLVQNKRFTGLLKYVRWFRQNTRVQRSEKHFLRHMRMLSKKLITEKPEVLNRGAYYDGIVNTILEIGAAEKLIIAIAELIQRLVVDHLHIIGDIYDRGSGAHKIMDKLCSYHSLDIQWGNHDILWMGGGCRQSCLHCNRYQKQYQIRQS